MERRKGFQSQSEGSIPSMPSNLIDTMVRLAKAVNEQPVPVDGRCYHDGYEYRLPNGTRWRRR